jgi:hypothetical protein
VPPTRHGLPAPCAAYTKALIAQCTTCDVNGYVPGGEDDDPITIICCK